MHLHDAVRQVVLRLPEILPDTGLGLSEADSTTYSFQLPVERLLGHCRVQFSARVLTPFAQKIRGPSGVATILRHHFRTPPRPSCLIRDAASRRAAVHPSTPWPVWLFPVPAGHLAECPSSHSNRLHSTFRRSEALRVGVGWRGSIKTRDPPSRYPCSSLLHPAILSCPAPRLLVGQGIGQRPLPKRPRIVGDSGLRTVLRARQPFVQLRPAPAS